jgi:hypothetical protein
MLRPQNFQLIGICDERLCHGSGNYSPVRHRRCPGLIAGLSLWDLWLTKWHWGQVLLGVLQTSLVIIIALMLLADSVSNFIHPLCQVVGIEHINQVMISRLRM